MSKNKVEGRMQRKLRIRKKITGTSERPRLTIFRSLKHLYAQVIDDSAGKTLVAVSTLEKGQEKGRPNKAQAEVLGKRLAERAKTQNIGQVVFDRNGYIYHGCVKAFADAVREGGLKF
jgi:ribosomal protein L18, bacterial type